MNESPSTTHVTPSAAKSAPCSPKTVCVAQADFLRAIVAAAYGPDSEMTIQSSSFSNFTKQKGPLAGNTSGVYYAAYVFF
ncbi:hypothetical protein B0T14DRAFT_528540 [Immersiella caudata]|uniref:DUF7726 domain-containing protein n=1 Tax=Immersiella caudata TaxID=314043 RepID=A0AA39WFK3_9PEZI|nr:hypothetical protein B0T14DRAFT_528540 [Immersiella caudata]